MAIPSDVLDAFRRLIEEHGSEVEPYINIDRFWEQRKLLRERRRSLEKHLQQEYLPGFKFQNEAHFRWHFHERDDPYLILRGRLPERYFEHWIRSILVPSALHYRAEIAYTMKNWEQRYRRRLEKQRKWGKTWSWVMRVRKILELGPVLSPDSDHSKVEERSIYRWAQMAPKYRQARSRGNRGSGWQIECIALPGDHKAGLGKEYDHETISVDDPLLDYRETWIWNSEQKEPAPNAERITFTVPAPAYLWRKQWLAKKPKGPAL